MKKGLITLLITSIIIAGGYVFLFIKVNSINLEVAKSLSEIRSEDNKEAQLRMVGKSLETTTEERKRLQELFVGSESVVAFIELLESLGTDAGTKVTIESLTVTESNFEHIENLNIRLSAEGNYKDVYGLTQAIGELPYSVIWKRLSFNKEASEEEISSWSLVSDFSVLKLK